MMDNDDTAPPAEAAPADAESAHRQEIDRAIAAFQRNEDREANFQILITAYYRTIERFFSRRVSNPQDRLDLTQETFLRVYKSLEGFRRQSQFGTWLFRIASNVHSNWRRRRSVRQEVGYEQLARDSGNLPGRQDEDAALPETGQVPPLEELLQQERGQRLHEAIRSLPAQMRRCMTLRVVHDMSYREIADTMQISIDTVKAHLFKARKKLREELEGVFGEADFWRE